MIRSIYTLSSVVLILGLFLAPQALEAQNASRDYVPLTGISGITQGSGAPVNNQGDLSSFFQNIFNLLIGIAGILAVIMLSWGGIEYMASDVITNKESAKSRMWGATLGLLLVLFSVAILYSINPDILSLRVLIPTLIPTTSSSQSTGCDPQTQDCITPNTVLPGTGFSLTYFTENKASGCYVRTTREYSTNQKSTCDTALNSARQQAQQSGSKINVSEACVSNLLLPATPSGITLCK